MIQVHIIKDFTEEEINDTIEAIYKNGAEVTNITYLNEPYNSAYAYSKCIIEYRIKTSETFEIKE